MPAKLALKVIPGAAQTAIVGWLGDELKIRVKAPAEKGKANQCVKKLLADTFGIKQHSVTIVRGHTNARKIVEIDGLSLIEVKHIIAQLA